MSDSTTSTSRNWQYPLLVGLAVLIVGFFYMEHRLGQEREQHHSLIYNILHGAEGAVESAVHGVEGVFHRDSDDENN